MIYVTRRERFSAAHRLFREEWDDEKNMEIFDKCSYPNWHGHNYVLYVTVKGNLNPETGFVVNIKRLSKIINEEIISKLDHKNLNMDENFLKKKNEYKKKYVIGIWNKLKQIILSLGIELHKVRIEETENNFVEYFGD